MLTLALIVSVLAQSASPQVHLHETFPPEIYADQRYVISLHGLIAEGDDPRPVHPENGVYDFPAIKHALFKDGGFNLIAQQRPKNADLAKKWRSPPD
jgi:hypothetical protein